LLTLLFVTKVSIPKGARSNSGVCS